MRTSKPFSTIWFGSEAFLESQLNALYREHAISFWAYIFHHAEGDTEEGSEKKDHRHLYVVPDGRLDTASFMDRLTELDMTNPLPIRCLPCRSSKWDDWYLYSIHDSRYLASKGQKRKYHYTPQDVKSSDPDYLLELIHTIDMSKLSRYQYLVDAVDQGLSFDSVVRSGQIPLNQLHQAKLAYDVMYKALMSANYLPHELGPNSGSVTQSQIDAISSEPGAIDLTALDDD